MHKCRIALLDQPLGLFLRLQGEGFNSQLVRVSGVGALDTVGVNQLFFIHSSTRQGEKVCFGF